MEDGEDASFADWLSEQRPALARRTIHIYPAGMSEAAAAAGTRAGKSGEKIVALTKPVDTVELVNAVCRLLPARD